MSTDLFFGAGTATYTTTPEIRAHAVFGDPTAARINGTSPSAWVAAGAMHPTRSTIPSAGTNTTSVNTVAGPTNGIEIGPGGIPYEWVSPPIDQDVTISGTMTFNLWAFESNMNANAAVNCLVERVDHLGAVVSTIIKTTRTTEVAITTPAVNNFTGTPTSTAMNKGDRFRVRVFFDDAGTMGSGFTATFVYGQSTVAASGDSWIRFNETFGFLVVDPSTTVLYLYDVASDCDPDSDNNLAMWTDVPDVTRVTASVTPGAGPISPLQLQRSSVNATWYSKPLQSVTLQAPVLAKIRSSSSGGTNALRVELAVVDIDGAGATIWASVGSPWHGAIGTDQVTSENFSWAYLSGDDIVITDGQRLRLRVFVDDVTGGATTSGFPLTMYYDSDAPAETSQLLLGQTLAEYTPPVTAAPSRVQLVAPSTAVHRAGRW